MALELLYEKKEQIPPGYEELYTEKKIENKETGEMEVQWVLTEIIGMKSQADVDKVQTALVSEREQHAETKKKLKPWADKNPEEVEETAAKLKEALAQIEALGDDGDRDILVQKLFEAKLAKSTDPLNRTIKELEEKLETVTSENVTLSSAIEDRSVRDEVRSAATVAKVNPSAMPDIEMLSSNFLERDENGKLVTKDGNGYVGAGLSLNQFFEDMKGHKTHWWPVSQGAGSVDPKNKRKIIGFEGENPWSHEHWNKTKQGQVYLEHGPEMATKLAEAMGTKVIGGDRPAPLTD